jgi:hypothetical protein
MKCYIEALHRYFGIYHHFKVKVMKDNVFTLTPENMSSLKACNGNGVMGANWAKLLLVKSRVPELHYKHHWADGKAFKSR